MLLYLILLTIHAVIITYIYVRNDWHMDEYWGHLNVLFVLHLIFGSVLFPLAIVAYLVAGPCWLTYKLATKHRVK